MQTEIMKEYIFYQVLSCFTFYHTLQLFKTKQLIFHHFSMALAEFTKIAIYSARAKIDTY